MCAICDGESYESVALGLLEEIDDDGWAVVGVEAGRGHPSWAYTVGLSPSFDHPELVVVDLLPSYVALILNTLAGEVSDGEELDVGETIDLGDHAFVTSWVHPRHFDLGTFAFWTSAIEPAFVDRPRRAALQIVPPPCLSESGADPTRWLLNRPRRLLGTRAR
jgi:hypothetical protein